MTYSKNTSRGLTLDWPQLARISKNTINREVKTNLDFGWPINLGRSSTLPKNSGMFVWARALRTRELSGFNRLPTGNFLLRHQHTYFDLPPPPPMFRLMFPVRSNVFPERLVTLSLVYELSVRSLSHSWMFRLFVLLNLFFFPWERLTVITIYTAYFFLPRKIKQTT